MTDQERTLKTVTRAAKRRRAAVAEYDAAIRQARAAGNYPAAIAQAAGVTRSAVNQKLQGAELSRPARVDAQR